MAIQPLDPNKPLYPYNSDIIDENFSDLDGRVDTKANDSGVVHNTGNETVAWVKTFSSFAITPSSNPTTDYQVANKKYVDDAIAWAGGKFVFAIAGTIWATATNVWNTILVPKSVTFTTCNIWYGTAGNGTLTVDINKNWTTMFSSTKPQITGTNNQTLNSGTLTTTTAVAGDRLTLDIVAVPATPWVDLYVELFYT